ncbi:uncharacterized protein AMSG_11094 [Thecamonas trahens ATCC 50062]|uniref:Uncharacterized protein n=1 Tax=Thecamonas trahens ATCC 50062 TaxID=461836 RepID=A0A0L0DT81_THETB|nr:hypothetical protein AMSG_11094 [Thecamonas trahens ATCC 50062]KNC55432.1 hypothetical protein AMSG_11094 [Thecamonas trahens ATCC 50062]|eukprot:XP_013752969.1 hypothetical protein AMSG_11094 [Thecamonas trahens ATCC 50062]
MSRELAFAAVLLLLAAASVAHAECPSFAPYNANLFRNGGKGYVFSDAQYTYDIAICEPLSSSVCSGQSDITVCQEWGPGASENKILGAEKYSFSSLSSSSDEGFILTMGGVTDSDCLPSGNQAKLTLTCDRSVTGDLKFSYDGYAACSGLSLGSIILIIALVLSVVYLIAGMAWQYKKGERGVVGLLPHKSFWASIPGLIKDGCAFTYDKIRQVTSSGTSYSSVP